MRAGTTDIRANAFMAGSAYVSIRASRLRAWGVRCLLKLDDEVCVLA